MGIVQLFVAALMFSVQLVTTSPVTEVSLYYTEGGRTCQMCPPGHYWISCMECKPCPAGSYMSVLNREDSCRSCFSDCRTDFHLKVVQNCTPTTELKCSCEVGYSCSDFVPHTTNCRYCTEIQKAAVAPAAISDNDKPTQVASGHSDAFTPPCQFPKCGSQPGAQRGNGTDVKTDKTNNHLVAILCSVVAMAFFSFTVLFCVNCSGNETCFKLGLIKLRNKGGRDASSYKRKESTRQSIRDSTGSVHVHNPGTVIFSLLSQFTGQVGPTRDETRDESRERANREEDEEDERGCPVFHPTPSPAAHLSEEERSAETDGVFFPSQEQGKDCHVSKEEVQ